MSDRFVRQIDPPPSDEVVPSRRISDYLNFRNIILVGDPGAGKTHLFDELAGAAGTKAQTARQFLNSPVGPPGSTLFIDALDEKRAGRSDQATIDQIVQQLFRASAENVRLACREHDWLGGTDLAAFHPYFSQSGGYVVLALEPLTETEQRDILLKAGVINPQKFIREAERKGLSEFLTNPQNLKMLSEVVSAKAWPKTRSQLLQDTTAILLSEHNLGRVRSGDGQYSVKEVQLPAGAACALRLISDVDGISLIGADIASTYPSYRTIPFAQPDVLLAALGRRLFRSLSNEAVDYSHRVRAEYAAANWLAQRIRDGLPLSRIQALIGIDGVPAPELRGMHAWLAVLLPEFSDPIIDADPFGILIHSDAHSLALSQRRRLLDALSRLAEADPFFRPDEKASSSMSALCRADMVPDLKRMLRDRRAPNGIKRFILDALGNSAPLPALKNEILAFISDRSVPFGIKASAIRAAGGMWDVIGGDVMRTYRSLGPTADEIRLRAFLLSTFYVGNFNASDVCDLFLAAISLKDELVGGVLWQIPSSIPSREVPHVLDTMAANRSARAPLKVEHNRYELERLIERLIVRALEECAGEIDGRRVWSWLSIGNSITSLRHENRHTQAIKPLLAKEPQLSRQILDAALDSLTRKSPPWRLTGLLREILPYPLSAAPLRRLVERIDQKTIPPWKRLITYELAFSWLFGGDADNIEIFELLHNLAEREPALVPVREQWTRNQVQEWHTREKQRAIANVEKRRIGRLKNLAQFTENMDQIKSGDHVGWLIWSADVYFANFSDVEADQLPRERLERELGQENAAVALQGLKAYVRKGLYPSLNDLAESEAKNSYPKRWQVLLAGMDELWLETPSVSTMSDAALTALVCIDLLLPTVSRSKTGTSERDRRTWKDHIVSMKPELVRDAYLFLVEAGLKDDRQFISALHSLLNDDAFASSRGAIVLSLLSKYPHFQPQRLEDLLQIAIVQSPRVQLLGLARERLSSKAALGVEQRALWAVVAYLLDPDEFLTTFLEEARSSASIVWRMRALTSYDRQQNSRPAVVLTPHQREVLARTAALHFGNTGHPTGGWSGDENAWDAAEYIRGLLDALSADSNDAATAALQRLAIDPAMSTYRDSIKHALANQRARHREMAYRQPSWSETVATLSGGTPANVADLCALTVEMLREISTRIGTENVDIYKGFWNEDGHGRPLDPKVEESARDVLLALLRSRLAPLGILAEPEGHMVADKRADVTAALAGQKITIELKRDIHPEIWSAAVDQLDRFYTRDPESKGYGIFGVFWYGEHRKGRMPKPPGKLIRPTTARDLETMLNDLIRAENRSKLHAVVIDVSIPDGQSVGADNKEPKKSKRPSAADRKPNTKKTKAPKTKYAKGNTSTTKSAKATAPRTKTVKAKAANNKAANTSKSKTAKAKVSKTKLAEKGTSRVKPSKMQVSKGRPAKELPTKKKVSKAKPRKAKVARKAPKVKAAKARARPKTKK